MSDELFTIPESRSPRLVWMEANQIKTHHAPHCEEDPWIAVAFTDDHWKRGANVGEAMAEECVIYEESGRIGYGQTEINAIIELAKKLSLKLWNEQ